MVDGSLRGRRSTPMTRWLTSVSEERSRRRALGLRAEGKDLTSCNPIAYSAQMGVSIWPFKAHCYPGTALKSWPTPEDDVLYGRFLQVGLGTTLVEIQ